MTLEAAFLLYNNESILPDVEEAIRDNQPALMVFLEEAKQALGDFRPDEPGKRTGRLDTEALATSQGLDAFAEHPTWLTARQLPILLSSLLRTRDRGTAYRALTALAQTPPWSMTSADPVFMEEANALRFAIVHHLFDPRIAKIVETCQSVGTLELPQSLRYVSLSTLGTFVGSEASENRHSYHSPWLSALRGIDGLRRELEQLRTMNMTLPTFLRTPIQIEDKLLPATPAECAHLATHALLQLKSILQTEEQERLVVLIEAERTVQANRAPGTWYRSIFYWLKCLATYGALRRGRWRETEVTPLGKDLLRTLSGLANTPISTHENIAWIGSYGDLIHSLMPVFRNGTKELRSLDDLASAIRIRAKWRDAHFRHIENLPELMAREVDRRETELTSAYAVLANQLPAVTPNDIHAATEVLSEGWHERCGWSSLTDTRTMFLWRIHSEASWIDENCIEPLINAIRNLSSSARRAFVADIVRNIYESASWMPDWWLRFAHEVIVNIEPHFPTSVMNDNMYPTFVEKTLEGPLLDTPVAKQGCFVQSIVKFTGRGEVKTLQNLLHKALRQAKGNHPNLSAAVYAIVERVFEKTEERIFIPIDLW